MDGARFVSVMLNVRPGDPDSHSQDFAADGAHARLQERNGWRPV